MLASIFESHAHYDDDAFDIDRTSLLNTFIENRIGNVINVGSSIESTKKTVKLMEEFPFIYGAVGVHPSETAKMTHAVIRWLEELCKLDKTVAVGEIGLDYHWQEPDPAIQKHWFCEQLSLAERTSLPVIIHSRDAAKDTLDIMKAEHAENLPGVIHCFSYSKEIAREYLNMNYYFGIGGVITFANARKLKEVVSYLPMEHILLETDSPYLTPVPNRGKRNTSLNLPVIAQEIANLKHMDVEDVIAVTEQNAKSLFQKVR